MQVIVIATIGMFSGNNKPYTREYVCSDAGAVTQRGVIRQRWQERPQEESRRLNAHWSIFG